MDPCLSQPSGAAQRSFYYPVFLLCLILCTLIGKLGFVSHSSYDWIFALRDAEPITAMELAASIGTCIPLMAIKHDAISSIPGFCFSCSVYTYDTGVVLRSRCLRMNGYLRMHSMRRRKRHCLCSVILS
jgi:hypothetical protein